MKVFFNKNATSKLYEEARQNCCLIETLTATMFFRPRNYLCAA